MVNVDDPIVKLCVETKARITRGGILALGSTHRFTIVIYTNHMVSKVITICGQPYDFQGQPWAQPPLIYCRISIQL